MAHKPASMVHVAANQRCSGDGSSTCEGAIRLVHGYAKADEGMAWCCEASDAHKDHELHDDACRCSTMER